MTDKLLPCPFCGGKADYCETSAWWVRCNECNAETEADMSPEAAAEIWNRRTPPPSTLVAGLDDAIRGEGYAAGVAMSVAFLIRDRDQPSTALEWWRASGLTLEQCERANVDEYDMAPIRAALATTEGSTE